MKIRIGIDHGAIKLPEAFIRSSLEKDSVLAEAGYLPNGSRVLLFDTRTAFPKLSTPTHANH